MAKLTPEFADRVRQICADALPMQIVRREGNNSFYNYMRPGQVLTDEKVIGLRCRQKNGYLQSSCVSERPWYLCPREEKENELAERMKKLG